MTNGDRIRKMSDDGLADMIHNMGAYVENENPYIEIWVGDEKTVIDDDLGYIKEWLGQGR